MKPRPAHSDRGLLKLLTKSWVYRLQKRLVGYRISRSTRWWFLLVSRGSQRHQVAGRLGDAGARRLVDCYDGLIDLSGLNRHWRHQIVDNRADTSGTMRALVEGFKSEPTPAAGL